MSGPGTDGGYGAAFAAGWPDDGWQSTWYAYWTGQSRGDDEGHDSAWVVYLDYGSEYWNIAVELAYPLAVCLP